MSYSINEISLNGAKMKYMHFGEGERNLVIIPGLSLTGVLPFSAAVEKQYEIFSKDFSVYLFDYRENPQQGISVFDMMQDVAEAMNKLKLYDSCVFGASLGGMLTILLASNHPKLTKKIALGSTVCCLNSENSSVLENWISLAERGETEKLCLSFGEKVYPKNFFEQNREAFSAMAKTASKQDISRFEALAKGAGNFDATDDLKRIKCPVLIIGDSSDEVFKGNSSPEIKEKLSENASCELFMYDGFGHAVYDMALDYAQKLYDFFI